MMSTFKLLSESFMLTLRRPMIMVYAVCMYVVFALMQYVNYYYVMMPAMNALVSNAIMDESGHTRGTFTGSPIAYALFAVIIFHFLSFILTCYIQSVLRHQNKSLTDAFKSAVSLYLKASWLLVLSASYLFCGGGITVPPAATLFVSLVGLIILPFIGGYFLGMHVDIFYGLCGIPMLVVELPWLAMGYASQLVIDRHFGLMDNIKHSFAYIKKTFVQLIFLFVIPGAILLAIVALLYSYFTYVLGIRVESLNALDLMSTLFEYLELYKERAIFLGVILSIVLLWIKVTLRIAFNKLYLEAKNH